MSPGTLIAIKGLGARVLAPWLTLTLADVAAWGLGSVVAKKATVDLGSARMVLMVSAVDGPVWLVWWALFNRGLQIGPVALAMGLLAGFSGMVGYVLFYESLNHGSVALVGLITGASPLVTIVAAIAFLRETLGLLEAVGVALLIACLLLLSYEPYTSRHVHQARAITYALLVFCLWGGWGFFTKLAVDDLRATAGVGGENDIVAFFAVANFSVGLTYYFLRRRSIATGSRPPLGRLAAYAANTFILALGILALTFAYAEGEASLVSAVSGTYPLVTVGAARVLLKERITLSQWVAAGLFVPGIVLVAL